MDYDPDNQDGYQIPEVQVISSDPPFDDPLRVLEGKQALYLSGSNKVFDAGILQQVGVTPGDTLCLTGFAHAWSAHKQHDPHQSTLMSNDDQRNANFMLGIDPEGGTDPWATRVIWGPVTYLYDTYGMIPSVKVQAQSDRITVFVRGYTLWRFDHNDLFFDNFTLVTIASASTLPPTP